MDSSTVTDRGGYFTHNPYRPINNERSYSYAVDAQGFTTFTAFCPPCAHGRGFTLEAAGSQRCGWSPVVGAPCHDCGREV